MLLLGQTAPVKLQQRFSYLPMSGLKIVFISIRITFSPEINILRIAKRYLNGGHEVPMSKVFSRYYKSIENASLAVEFVDRAYVYDNSIEDHIPQLLYRTMNGKIVKRYTESVPEWAKQIID